MDIRKLWFTQKKLKRISQVETLISIYNSSRFSTFIFLALCEDGHIEIRNGHHRIYAMFVDGKYELNPEDYFMIDHYKSNRYGKVEDFFEYYKKVGTIK